MAGLALGQSPQKVASTAAAAAANLKQSQGALPLVFEENAGQLPTGTAFAGRTQQYTVQIRPAEMRFGLLSKKRERTISVSFAGSEGARPEAMSDAGFRTNLYIGNDPRTWHTGIRNFDRVALRQLYPGIDAEFYARGEEIEHDFMLAPGADASRLNMHLAGAQSIKLTPAGDLLLSAEDGALRLHKPVAYQVLADGKHQPVDAEFDLAQNATGADLRFKLGGYDHARALVIDPVITYASYISGDASTTPVGVVTDSSGNVYVAGTTLSTSKSFRGTSATLLSGTSGTLSDPPAHAVAFVAAFTGVQPNPANIATAPNGYAPQIAWMTFYGSTSADVTASALAMQPAAAVLYFGGQTTATDLAGTGAGFQNNGEMQLMSGNQFGFIAGLNTADGTAYNNGTNNGQYATYVDGSGTTAGSTIIGALAVDTTGNVTAVGEATGTSYPTTAVNTVTVPGFPVTIPLPPVVPAAPTTFCSTTGLTGNYFKGIITTLDSTLSTQRYGSYLCGNTNGMVGGANGHYYLTGVSVVPGSSATAMPMTYYVAGSTNLTFPESGVYNLPTVDLTNLSYDSPAFWMPNGTNTSDAFAASLAPSTLTVNYSFWSNGENSDAATALATDTNNNVFLVGATTSTMFASSAEVSTTSTAGAPAAVTSLNSTYPTGVTQAGFAVGLNTNGYIAGLTFLAGPSTTPASATTTTATSIVTTTDGTTANNAVFIVGQTNELKPTFPVGTTVNTAMATTLPAEEDFSANATTSSRGFLLEMPNTLDNLAYRAYFGPPTGTSGAVSVAAGAATIPDGNTPSQTTSPFAFVLLSEQQAVSATNTPSSYTTSSATGAGAQSNVTQAAYLAQVAYTAPAAAPTISFTAPAAGAANAPTPNPVGYASSTNFSTLQLTWPVVVGNAAVNRLTFNLPASPYLQDYKTATLAVYVNATQVTDACFLGPEVSPANAFAGYPGYTCVLTQVPANATVSFILTDGVSAAVTPGPITITATASDAQSTDQLNTVTPAAEIDPPLTMPLSITVAGVPTFTITDTATNSPKSAPTVNAYSSPTSMGAATQVTYTYTIQNTSTYDSPNTKLTTYIDLTKLTNTTTSITVSSPSSTSGCDPTSAANGCDIPAGATLTYAITGVYQATQFSGAGPYEVDTAAPQISFTPVLTNSTQQGPNSLAIFINGVAVLTQSLAITSPSSPTYPASTPAGYRLGDVLTFTATVSNSGPNQADSYTATVTLPHGFVATSSAVVTGNGASNCTQSPYTTCTFTSIAAGGSASFSITGYFSDTGAVDGSNNPIDAVAPPAAPAPAGGPAAAQVAVSATFGSVTAYLQAMTPGENSGTYINTVTASTALSFPVTRVNALSFTTTFTAPIAGNTANETSPLDSTNPPPVTNDTLGYSVVVKNTGISVARGIFFTIPLPQPASGMALNITSLTVTPATYPAPIQLTCSASNTAATITCYSNDLVALSTTPATLAQTPSVTAQSYTITFNTSYNETAIPQATTTGKLALTENPGTLFAAAAGYNTAGGTASSVNGGASAMINLQRATSLVQTLSYTPVGKPPATFTDTQHINLDEHTTGNVPGVNDTITIKSSVLNTGINDAAGVAISIPLLPYMEVAVPANCTLNGTTGPTATGTLVATGATGSAMVCSTPSSATSAATAAMQLAVTASGGSCSTLNSVPLSATTFSGSMSDGKCLTVAFYAKFVDANSAATIVGGSATKGVTFSAATIAENDVDAAPSSTLGAVSTQLSMVQRAAHVHVSSILVPTYTDNTGLLVDLGSALSEIAQAAIRVNVATRQPLTPSAKVYNCVRYPVALVNDGPNYANHPGLNFQQSVSGFISTQDLPSTSATNKAALDCAGATPPTAALAANTNQLVDAGSIMYGGGKATTYLDGFFDVGTLGVFASSPATLTTTQFTTTDYNDSNTTATNASDFAATRKLTLVNTPYNDSTTPGFTITSYSAPSAAAPQVSLFFTQVTQPGITSANLEAVPTTGTLPNCTAATTTTPCLPSGVSPYPPDKSAVRSLYQLGGKSPQVYALPTTALVPTSTSNPTGACISTGGGALPDVFVKPERALLWVIANPSTGTSYNAFPSGYATFNGAITGDITTAVLPVTGATYVQLPGKFTFPQVPQAQPGMVCGSFNGLVSASTVAAAQTLAVLEPVNFPPLVVAGSLTASNSATKGSTAALADFYVQVAPSGSTTRYTYDYNDRDPCYIASNSTPRQTCNDNPYLYAFSFPAGSDGTPTPKLLSGLSPEPASGAPVDSFNVSTNVNLTGSSLGYVAVADQATGADAHDTDISKTAGYTSNPFVSQGHFLQADYSVSTSTGAPSVCDPGVSTSSSPYTPTGTPCTTVTAVAGTLPTTYVPGGSTGTGTATFALGNVGAQAVQASGISGTGLIFLPIPDSTVSSAGTPPAPTAPNPYNPGGFAAGNPLGYDPTTKGTTAAMATVTAGQTVGFEWGWLANETAGAIAGGAGPNDKYNLACALVTAPNYLITTPATPFPAGLTCNISTTTPDNAAASGSVYTFANGTFSNGHPVTAGSTPPTIYVVTNGNLYAQTAEPVWKRGMEGLALAMLLPVFFFRKRLGKGAILAALLLTLAVAPLLTGCGSGSPVSSTTATPTGQYFFRVTATPQSGSTGTATITSAVFEVQVQ